jgi:hypothetical protein
MRWQKSPPRRKWHHKHSSAKLSPSPPLDNRGERHFTIMQAAIKHNTYQSAPSTILVDKNKTPSTYANTWELLPLKISQRQGTTMTRPEDPCPPPMTQGWKGGGSLLLADMWVDQSRPDHEVPPAATIDRGAPAGGAAAHSATPNGLLGVRIPWQCGTLGAGARLKVDPRGATTRGGENLDPQQVTTTP